MAKFSWKSLDVYVGEMSRAASLEFSQEAELMQLVSDQQFLAREVDFLITRYARSKVMCNGVLLEDGTHQIDIGDDETMELVLPLTRDNFNQLPVSLAAAWTKAAEAENQLVTDFFLQSLKKLAENISATS